MAYDQNCIDYLSETYGCIMRVNYISELAFHKLRMLRPICWGEHQEARCLIVHQRDEIVDEVKSDAKKKTNHRADLTNNSLASPFGQLKILWPPDPAHYTLSLLKCCINNYGINSLCEKEPITSYTKNIGGLVPPNDPKQPCIYGRPKAAKLYLAGPKVQPNSYSWPKDSRFSRSPHFLSIFLHKISDGVQPGTSNLASARVDHTYYAFIRLYFYKCILLERQNSDRSDAMFFQERLPKRDRRSDIWMVADMCELVREFQPDWPQLVLATDEDFGGNHDIPEEVQTKLLEEYEQEVKQRDSDEEQEKIKETVNKPVTEDTKENEPTDPSKNELEIDISKNTETTGKSSPASTESNESDEWEKVDSCDATSTPADKTDVKDKQDKTDDSKTDDWENWDN
ncbi:unnamed protein product, partial [Meganyctiphanes norvegica]